MNAIPSSQLLMGPTGPSMHRMLKALSDGETNPAALAALPVAEAIQLGPIGVDLGGLEPPGPLLASVN